MEWNDEEVARCREAFRGDGGMEAAMTRAVELFQARSGGSEAIWRKRVEQVAELLAPFGQGEVGRLDVVSRTRILVERLAALQPTGQVADDVALIDDDMSLSTRQEAALSRLAAGARRAEELARSLEALREHYTSATGLGRPWKSECRDAKRLFVIGEDAPEEITRGGTRYPCSPTCTHDDAATPGHPERVTDRSEAWAAVSTSGQRANYDEGAEAMRLLCLHAVHAALEEAGLLGSPLAEQLRKNIEGATP